MPDFVSKIDESLCPLCGNANQCAIEIEKITGEKQAGCWCVNMDFSPEVLARVPASAQRLACICAACAANSPPDLPSQSLSG